MHTHTLYTDYSRPYTRQLCSWRHDRLCVLRMKYWMLYSTSHLEIDCPSICKWLVECSTQYFMHRWSCCLVASDKVASCMVCPTEHVLNRKLASRSRSRVNYEPIWHNGSLNMYVFDENLSLNLKIMRITLHVHVGTSMWTCYESVWQIHWLWVTLQCNHRLFAKAFLIVTSLYQANTMRGVVKTISTQWLAAIGTNNQKFKQWIIRGNLLLGKQWLRGSGFSTSW